MLLVEAFAFGELHRRGDAAPGDFFERVDRGDSGMIERCEQPRLSLEPLLPLFTFEEIFRQYLDRDLPIEARVLRPVDLPHPPRSEEREDLVGAELRGGGERHRAPFAIVQFTTRSTSGFGFCPSPTTRKRWWSDVGENDGAVGLGPGARKSERPLPSLEGFAPDRDRNRPDHAAEVVVEDLLAVGAPERVRAAVGRDLPLPSRARERGDVDLPPARLVRAVRQPPAVGRQRGIHLVELRLRPGLRLPGAVERERQDLGSRVLSPPRRRRACGRRAPRRRGSCRRPTCSSTSSSEEPSSALR